MNMTEYHRRTDYENRGPGRMGSANESERPRANGAGYRPADTSRTPNTANHMRVSATSPRVSAGNVQQRLTAEEPDDYDAYHAHGGSHAGSGIAATFRRFSPVQIVLAVGALALIILVIMNVSFCTRVSTLESANASISTSLVKAQGERDVARANAVATQAAQSATTASDTSSDATDSGTYTGVEDRWTASGRFTTGNAQLDQEVKGFCDSFTDDNASALDNLYATFKHISYYDFYTDDHVNNPEGADWTVQWALELFDRDAGDCYSVAALLQWCGRYFGYEDATAIPAMVGTESGGYGEHGFVLMTVDGTQYLFDSTKGTNGWMLNTDYYDYIIRDV